MARPPRVRVDGYQHDSQQMLRLAEAVKKDPKRPEAWRNKVIKQLTATARLLLEYP